MQHKQPPAHARRLKRRAAEREEARALIAEQTGNDRLKHYLTQDEARAALKVQE